MSVIVRDPEGKLLLLSKGAETIMFDLLAPNDQAKVRWGSGLQGCASSSESGRVEISEFPSISPTDLAPFWRRARVL
jgi:hypothetical protein